MSSRTILCIYGFLLAASFLWERLLTVLNLRHLRIHGEPSAEALRIMSQETYHKSLAYAVARDRLSLFSSSASSLLLVILVWGGWFGRIQEALPAFAAVPLARDILLVYVVSLLFQLVALPFQIYSQFGIEARFGFNRMGWSLFLLDLLKELLLSALLFTPLLAAFFALFTWSGRFWWLWGFLLMAGFQLLLSLIYPTLIAPWFNRFRPLEDGILKERVHALASSLGFRVKSLLLMDGSRRSGHSNAYFTGLGLSKRIVLFDTLVETLSVEQVLAVLSHEIGHDKLGHVYRRLAVSLAVILAGFWIAAEMIRFQPLFAAFGFPNPPPRGGSVVLVFSFCLAPLGSLLQPLTSAWSRRQEFAADRFAASLGYNRDLQETLIALARDNLSSLETHPWYRFVRFSHPTLPERLRALENPG